MMDRKYVEVKPGYSHDGIIGVVLVSDGKISDLVPHESEVVVGGMQRFEEGWACGEEGHVLDIGVVLLFHR